MRIGELAHHTGVSAKTLRFYEARRLLPDPGRTAAGQRDYPPEAVARVRFIKRAQAAGLTLAQIATVLAARTSAQGARPSSRAASTVAIWANVSPAA